ncbi:MAG: hypothetical protein ABUT20_51235 [Bacteroidota bacterium]
MNKVKMFFIAAALVLVTAGVFAGKAKFLDAQVVAYNSGNYFPLTSSATLTDLTTTASGSQARIVSSIHPTINYSLYAFDGVSTYTPLYTTGF